MRPQMKESGVTRNIRKGRKQAVAFGMAAPLAVLVGGRHVAGVSALIASGTTIEEGRP